MLNTEFRSHHKVFIKPALQVNLHYCTYRVILITEAIDDVTK